MSWPVETPEEVIARIRERDGDAIADLVARQMQVAPTRKRQVPERVGVKAKAAPAWGDTDAKSNRSLPWNELKKAGLDVTPYIEQNWERRKRRQAERKASS